MHDPRVGRFFAIDPLASKYPFYSPYHFSSNSPIVAVELEGLESSKKINKNEKPFGFREYLARGLFQMVEGFINIGRITQFKAPLKHPILQTTPEENFGSMKSVYNTTFEVMSIWQTAKYGIGGEDNELNIFPTTFKAASTESETVVSSMSLMQKVQTRLNFVVKKYSSLIEKYGTKSIDFTKPVYEQKISGTGLKTKDLVQYREPGNSNPSPFFTFEGEDPSTLGIPKTYTQKYKVELDGEYKFLRSTAKTIEAFSPEKDAGVNGEYLGGGTQLYSPDAAKNATFTPVN